MIHVFFWDSLISIFFEFNLNLQAGFIIILQQYLSLSWIMDIRLGLAPLFCIPYSITMFMDWRLRSILPRGSTQTTEGPFVHSTIYWRTIANFSDIRNYWRSSNWFTDGPDRHFVIRHSHISPIHSHTENNVTANFFLLPYFSSKEEWKRRGKIRYKFHLNWNTKNLFQSINIMPIWPEDLNLQL